MNDAATPLSRHELEAKIVKRCWENEAFRQEFVSDPKATFVKYLRAPAADIPEVVVHEEPQGTWHIVIPARPGTAGQLSDAELEKVAGGVITPGGLAILVMVSVFAGGGAAASAAVSAGVGAGAGAGVEAGW